MAATAATRPGDDAARNNKTLAAITPFAVLPQAPTGISCSAMRNANDMWQSEIPSGWSNTLLVNYCC